MKKTYFLVIMSNLFISYSLSAALAIAHRCAPKFGNQGLTENSIAAIQSILALKKATGKPDAIEFDVRSTKDGHPIIMHDPNIDRTTQGKGGVSSLTLDEIRAWLLQDGQEIPTLTDILDVIDKQLVACIEIKCIEAVEPTAKILHDYITRKGWSTDDFVIISFDPHILKKISEHNLAIKIGLLIAGNPTIQDLLQTKNSNADYSIIYKDYITQELIDDVHNQDLKIITYVVDDSWQAKLFATMGVDGIASDDPTIFVQ